MTEDNYLELVDFVRRWHKRHPTDKTPFGKKVVKQCEKKIKEYENNNITLSKLIPCR